MKRYAISRAILVLLLGLLFCTVSLLYSCAAHTLIATEQGCFPAISIHEEDSIVAYDCARNKQLLRPVLRSEYYTAAASIWIYLEDEVLIVDPTQLFYLAKCSGWIEAQRLVVGSELYTANGQSVVVSDIRRVDCSSQFRYISIGDPHTIVIGRHHVIVHNHGSFEQCICKMPRISNATIAVPAGIVAIHAIVGGVSYAMTGAGLVVTCAVTPVATVAVSTCGVAAALVSRAVKGRWFWQSDKEKSPETWICAAPVKQNSRDYDKGYAKSAVATKGPEDHDKQKLIYEHNPKHGLYARGNISGAPDIATGQIALNCSWPIPGDRRPRIGFYNRKVIKFHCHRETREALYYHGFYIEEKEDINDLGDKAKAILIKNKIIKPDGKLLK